MRINERDILDLLRNGGNDEAGAEEILEQGLEKVASAENVLRENGLSLEDLDDDEALEVVAQAGLDQDEAEAIMELLASAGAEEDDEEGVEYEEDMDDEDDGAEKEASLQHMYDAGYVYALGFGDGMTEVEKTAAKKKPKGPQESALSKAYKNRLVSWRKQGRGIKTNQKIENIRQGAKNSEATRDALRGLFSKEGPTKLTKGKLNELPFLGRAVRKALLKGGGTSRAISKGKAGLLGGGLLAALGAGGYGIKRATD